MRVIAKTFVLVSLSSATILGGTNAAAHDHRTSALPRAMGQPEALRGTCAEIKSGSKAAGGMIGAIGGGIAGKALAAAAVQPEGVILGALIGAFVGTQIGGSQVTCAVDQRAEPIVEQELRPHHTPSQVTAPEHVPRRVVGGDWYQPSPHSYYGRERRGPLYAAPADFPRPAQVPRASFVGPSSGQMTNGSHPGNVQPMPCMVCTR